MGTTVLLVTHAVHRLTYANHIIVLGANGSLIEQGTLNDLRATGGYISLLETRYRADSNKSDIKYQDTPVNEPDAKHDYGADERGVLESDMVRQGGDLSLYGYYLGSVHWASTVLWMSCFILYGVASKLSEFLVNYWIEAVQSEGTSVNALYLGLYGMLALTTTAGLVGGGYHFVLYFSARSAETLHARLLKSVMNAPLAFFTSVDIGTTTNR